MQSHRRHFRARIALAAGLGAVVLALPIVGSTKQNPSERPDIESRIQTLHRELKITSDQEPGWREVAQAMRDNAKTMTEMRNRQTEQERTASAPQMIDAYAQTMDAHAEAVRKFASTFQPLYDAMSASQRKTADAVFRDKVHEAARKKS